MVDWSALDYSMAPARYCDLRLGQAKFEIPGLAYFRLGGDDRLSWLQGQATNDVRLLESRPWLDFCLTNPKGQIEAVCRAWRDVQPWINIATAQGEVLQRRVEETVILESVSLQQDLTDRVCLQGPRVERRVPLLGGAFPSDRTGSGGYELSRSESPVVERLSPEAYALATLEAGIPLQGLDYTDRTLPPELGPNFEAQHVSYTKGCYVGQEVLMRIKARGHTNKTWVGLRAESTMSPGDKVTYQGKEVGVVHRTAFSPAFGHIASATLRNEATEEGTEVLAGPTLARVVQMPILR
jgi:folate-binding protein YgfZ